MVVTCANSVFSTYVYQVPTHVPSCWAGLGWAALRRAALRCTAARLAGSLAAKARLHLRGFHRLCAHYARVFLLCLCLYRVCVPACPVLLLQADGLHGPSINKLDSTTPIPSGATPISVYNGVVTCQESGGGARSPYLILPYLPDDDTDKIRHKRDTKKYRCLQN